MKENWNLEIKQLDLYEDQVDLSHHDFKSVQILKACLCREND